MIRGERILLRAVERGDASHIYRWFNDATVMRYWGDPFAVSSTTVIQQQIEHWLDEEIRFGRPVCFVIEIDQQRPIGIIVFSQQQMRDRSVELSILIGEFELWGKGFGTDALQAIVDACFDGWNFHRIWVRSEADNQRAHRLYRRLGFREEGRLREATFTNGAYQDVVIFALLEGDTPGESGSGSTRIV